MEEGNRPFFYTVHAWGASRVILALSESRISLDWRALRSVLAARHTNELLEDYANDLLYMAVKANYKKFEAEPPSQIRKNLYKVKGTPADNRSGAEILEDVKKLFRRRKHGSGSI